MFMAVGPVNPPRNAQAAETPRGGRSANSSPASRFALPAPTALALRQAGLEYLLFDDEAAARAVNRLIGEEAAPEGGKREKTPPPARRPPRARKEAVAGAEERGPEADDARKTAAPVDFPAAWRKLLHKTQQVPLPEGGGTVLWTYWELGQDLCAAPDPGRRELIGKILRELAHPPGTHRFWPPTLPPPPDGRDGEEPEACAAFFWEGARLLKSRAVIIMGSRALRALEPPPSLRALRPFGQGLHLGRRVIALPSPEIFVREPQRLPSLIEFLRPALTSFARKPASDL
jgi:hypothetical protein